MKILSIFSSKIKDREQNVELSHKSLEKLSKSKNTIWFHASSMGEFEQAKPIIEIFKEKNPEIQIVASFFSPSGYNNQLKYKFADAIIYLPFDDRYQMNELIERINPSALIIIRYEIWRNLLELCSNKSIPVYLVAATFPNSSILNSFFKNFTLKNYNYFEKIYCVNQENFNKFKEFGVENIVLSTDTRFDRIIKNIENLKQNSFILNRKFWCDEKYVVVAGSTWEKDEDFLLELIKKDEFKNVSLVIVPHEPTEAHINQLTTKIDNFVLFTDLEKSAENISDLIKDKILIVNKIGVLLKLYSIADIAYVGGAFGVGVHSVTEPAGYGIPVLTGNGMTNSPDAITMKNFGGLLTFGNQQEIEAIFSKLINDKNEYQKISELNRNYVYKNKGESEKVYLEILKRIK